MRILSKLILLAIVFGPQSAGLAQAQVDNPEAAPDASQKESSDGGIPTDDAGQEKIGSAPEQQPIAKQADDTASGKDELILDPELAGSTPKPAVNKPVDQPSEPEKPSGQMRLVLRSRVASDIQWEDPREEDWEATQLAILEARVRRSERLRLEAGVRVRHQFAALREDTSDAEAERFELDAVPTAGYADVTIRDGLNLRAGYQIVHMGRFDVFSASNFLDAADLRNGPVSMPEAVEFAQLAVRVDWDPLSWLTLKVFYLPFFQPDLINLFDSDYALFPVTQAGMETMLNDLTGTEATSADGRNIRAILKRNLSRSARSKILESGFSAFAPEPSLAHPQGALCLNARGPAGEIGLTAGTALERLPALSFNENFRKFSRNALVDPADDPAAIEVQYNRFAVLALDGATDIGPVQIGVETAYMLDRTWYSSPTDWRNDAGEIGVEQIDWPYTERINFVQLGLRGEYLEDTGWILVLEGFSAYAVNKPSKPDTEWVILKKGRFLFGAAAHVGWTYKDAGLTLETSAALFNGPSYLIAPRVDLRIVSEFYVEVGAYFVGGPKPKALDDPHVALGGLYDGTDQVFVGLRWLP